MKQEKWTFSVFELGKSSWLGTTQPTVVHRRIYSPVSPTLLQVPMADKNGKTALPLKIKTEQKFLICPVFGENLALFISLIFLCAHVVSTMWVNGVVTYHIQQMKMMLSCKVTWLLPYKVLEKISSYFCKYIWSFSYINTYSQNVTVKKGLPLIQRQKLHVHIDV